MAISKLGVYLAHKKVSFVVGMVWLVSQMEKNGALKYFVQKREEKKLANGQPILHTTIEWIQESKNRVVYRIGISFSSMFLKTLTLTEELGRS